LEERLRREQEERETTISLCMYYHKSSTGASGEVQAIAATGKLRLGKHDQTILFDFDFSQ